MAAVSGERLKVLMTADSVGGVWRYAMDLCMAVRAHGVEPIIAGLRTAAARDPGAGGVPCRHQDGVARCAARLGGPRPVGSRAGSAAARPGDRRLPTRRAPSQHAALAHLVHPEVPCVATLHSCLASWWAAVRGTALPTEWEWNRDHLEEDCGRRAWWWCRPRLSPARSTRSTWATPASQRRP